jgi:hypothetical protein
VLAGDFVTAASDQTAQSWVELQVYLETTLTTTYRSRILNAVAPAQHLRVLRQPYSPRAS